MSDFRAGPLLSHTQEMGVQLHVPARLDAEQREVWRRRISARLLSEIHEAGGLPLGRISVVEEAVLILVDDEPNPVSATRITARVTVGLP